MTLKDFLSDKTLPVKIRLNNWPKDEYVEVIDCGRKYWVKDMHGAYNYISPFDLGHWEKYEKKKHIMYRYWHIDHNGKFDKFDSSDKWEQICNYNWHSDKPWTLLETEIIKEFEV